MFMFNECHIHLCYFAWLNVFHILNFCWSNTKWFLSVLIVFGKSFVFAKNSKISKISNISKTVLPCSSHLIVSQYSCMPPVASLHRRFSRLTNRSMSQLQKWLRKFSKILGFYNSHDSVWRLVREWKLQSWGYTEIFAAPFVTYSRVDLPVVKNT